MRHISYLADFCSKGGSYKDSEEWKSYYCEPELYYAASKDEILEKSGSLVPSRYIEFVDRDTEMDFQSALIQMSKDFKALNERWEENKKTMLYGAQNEAYMSRSAENG